jgi:hypothetical protein
MRSVATIVSLFGRAPGFFITQMEVEKKGGSPRPMGDRIEHPPWLEDGSYQEGMDFAANPNGRVMASDGARDRRNVSGQAQFEIMATR